MQHYQPAADKCLEHAAQAFAHRGDVEAGRGHHPVAAHTGAEACPASPCVPVTRGIGRFQVGCVD